MRKKAFLAGFVMLLMITMSFAALPVRTSAAVEDVLYVAMQEDIPDYNNYNLGSNSIWKAHVIAEFGFESLSATDKDLNSIPSLAQSWTFNENTLEVVITLRQGVLFHDGTPNDLTDNHEMTADDVVFSYKMARVGTTYSSNIANAFDTNDPATIGTVTEAELLAHVVKTGPYEVKMTMAKPFGQFFSNTLAVPIMPMYIWDKYDTTEGIVDVTKSELDMTWGTGPFYYADGVPNSYRVLKKFDGYWGKDFNGPGMDYLTPAGWPTFPKVVDTIHYKIYSSLDTAILALQGGDVDYIAWAVTAGRVPALQSDPNIQLEYMSDAGYFYLAFNMKREPMNSLPFRQAVSHLIDKEQIVDAYMGGFGQAGSAAVSPYFGDWFNPAVTKYPFNKEMAKQILDDAGFIDRAPQDGWRDMPDGTPMEKITLLTPPADYDPIRIRAGQMLATNMRELNINVEAKPIDFNTLVAKVNTFDYQMLNLGWVFTGYTECVSVLFDIYGPLQGSNTWAFWSEENPNPDYSEIGGVNTLADAATQAYADEFLAIEGLARANFTTQGQIEYTKQGQEIIAKAIPCNVLYYRTNVEAHNKIWANWTEFSGTLINPYSFCSLEYAGAQTSGGGAVTSSLSVGLTMGEKVACDETVAGTAMVINNLGKPVSGASVSIDFSNDIASASPATGITDANGTFKFNVQGRAAGSTIVWANATDGTLETSDMTTLLVSTLGGIAVQVTPEKTVLTPGESIVVNLLVTDVNGDPFEGATVSVDPYLLGYGTINPTSILTGADGTGTMTYTAPTANLPGQHMLVQLAAAVSHPQHTRTNLAVSQIVVYNDAPPDWLLTSIDSVSTTALNSTANVTTITVVLTDETGAPIQGEVLDIEYSNESRVWNPVFVTPATAVDGTASFDVTLADTGESGAVRVTIGMMTIPNGIHDTVTLTYADPADVLDKDYYGGYIQYDLTKFVEAWGSIHVTAYVFNQTGAPADGVNASIIVPAASAGQMMDWGESEFNPLWEWVGATLTTSADEQNLAAAGACATPMDGERNLAYFDYWYATGWAPVGVTLTGGVYEMDLSGSMVASLDLVTDIFVMPGSWCTTVFDGDEEFDTRADRGPWPLAYWFWGPSLISSSVGYGRAYNISAVTYSIDTPVLMAEDGIPDTTQVHVKVWDENNDPIEGADVRIYEGTGSGGDIQNNNYKVDPCYDPGTYLGRRTIPVPSDADGMSDFNVTTVVWVHRPIYSYTGGLTAIVNPSMFINAVVPGVSLAVISQTQLVVEPTREVVYIAPEPVTVVKNIGDYVTVKAQVLGADGEPYADLPVSIGVNLGTVLTPKTLTDSSGMATLGVDTSVIAGARAAFLAVSLITSGAPEGASCRIMVALVNEGPSIEITGPAADAEVERPDATITGGIFDANGIAEATLVVDGGEPIDLVVTEGSIAVAISKVLPDLAEGEHTVTISATDSLGISSEAEVSFTMVKAGGGADMLAWGLAIAAWVIVAVLLVFMYLKMWKPKSGQPTEPEMAESEVAEPEMAEPEPEGPK